MGLLVLLLMMMSTAPLLCSIVYRKYKYIIFTQVYFVNPLFSLRQIVRFVQLSDPFSPMSFAHRCRFR